jgi:hypothetical protein
MTGASLSRAPHPRNPALLLVAFLLRVRCPSSEAHVPVGLAVSALIGWTIELAAAAFALELPVPSRGFPLDDRRSSYASL